MKKRARRVTLRDIAAECGFSCMTVSSALRNDPHVRPETRRQILDTATRLGYRPDPEVSKLMTHLRSPSTHAFSNTLAFVNSWPDPQEAETGYVGQILNGARERAESLGFEVETFWLQQCGMTVKILSNILYHRNIRGIFLPPWSKEAEPPAFEWNKFSGVAATLSISTPHLHRIIPHIFKNTRMAMEELIRLGYRRIGLVDTTDSHRRSDGMIQGAYEQKCAEVFQRKVPPVLTVPPGEESTLLPWFKRYRPDAILSPRFSYALRLQAQGIRFPEDCGYLVLDSLQDAKATAIDQRPRMLGAAAIDVLTAQILHNEYGIPQNPQLIMIEGGLRPGTTTRAVV